jgi:hypothetical protein
VTLANKPASEMTLLEHYAGIALQGLLFDGGEVHYDDYAYEACRQAEAIIAELEKRQPKAEPCSVLFDGWQPMSTAPRGGWIEALCAPDTASRMRWILDVRWASGVGWLDRSSDFVVPLCWRPATEPEETKQ